LVVIVVDTADDGEPMGLAGCPRQMLADPVARDRGADRLELAAYFCGCGWLHVEGGMMRRPTLVEDEDARPRLALAPPRGAAVRRGLGGSTFEEPGQR